jgi:hypothetical protein
MQSEYLAEKRPEGIRHMDRRDRREPKESATRLT